MRRPQRIAWLLSTVALLCLAGSSSLFFLRMAPGVAEQQPPVITERRQRIDYDDIVRQSVSVRSARREREILFTEIEENTTRNEPLYVLSEADGVIVRERPSQYEPSWSRSGERCRNDVSYRPDEQDDARLDATQKRYAIHVDDRGYACTPWAMDIDSGCCISRKQFSCLGCRPADRCCDRFALCISCCMGGGVPSLGGGVGPSNIDTRPATSEGRRTFDDCRFRCRTSSRSLIYNHDRDVNRDRLGAILAHDLPFCYDGERAARISEQRIHDDSAESTPKANNGATTSTEQVEFLKIS